MRNDLAASGRCPAFRLDPSIRVLLAPNLRLLLAGHGRTPLARSSPLGEPGSASPATLARSAPFEQHSALFGRRGMTFDRNAASAETPGAAGEADTPSTLAGHGGSPTEELGVLFELRDHAARKLRDHAAKRLRDQAAEKLRDHAAEEPRDHAAEKLRGHAAEKSRDDAADELRDHAVENRSDAPAENRGAPSDGPGTTPAREGQVLMFGWNARLRGPGAPVNAAGRLGRARKRNTRPATMWPVRDENGPGQ